MSSSDPPSDISTEDETTALAIMSAPDLPRVIRSLDELIALVRSPYFETWTAADLAGVSWNGTVTRRTVTGLVSMAAYFGNIEALRRLHSRRLTLRETDSEGFTPAHYAAQNNRINFLRELIRLSDEPGDQIMSAGTNDGRTPVHLSVMSGHINVIRVLRELGAVPSLLVLDSLGRSAAHFAALFQHADILEFIATLGADTRRLLLARDNDGYTPAHLAASETGGGSARSSFAVISRAARDGGQSQAVVFSLRDNFGQTPAHIAASYGRVDALRALREFGAEHSFSDSDYNGRTPAHLAAEDNHRDVLVALHNFGAGRTFYVLDYEGHTPAMIAAIRGHLASFLFIGETDRSAVYSREVLNARNRTVAHVAAENGRENILSALPGLGLEECLTRADRDGRTPAHYAAEAGHASSLRVLIDNGGASALTVGDGFGHTPAHEAADRAHVSVLEVIESAGDEFRQTLFSSRANHGNVPAHLAAFANRVGVLAFLNGARRHGEPQFLLARNDRGETPVMWAAWHDSLDALDYFNGILGSGCFEETDNNGNTSAYFASDSDDADALIRLHRYGAGGTFLVANADGNTPAFEAARNANSEGLRFLGLHGAFGTFLGVNNAGDTLSAVVMRNELLFTEDDIISTLRVLFEAGCVRGVPRAVPGSLVHSYIESITSPVYRRPFRMDEIDGLNWRSDARGRLLPMSIRDAYQRRTFSRLRREMDLAGFVRFASRIPNLVGEGEMVTEDTEIRLDTLARFGLPLIPHVPSTPFVWALRAASETRETDLIIVALSNGMFNRSFLYPQERRALRANVDLNWRSGRSNPEDELEQLFSSLSMLPDRSDPFSAVRFVPPLRLPSLTTLLFSRSGASLGGPTPRRGVRATLYVPFLPPELWRLIIEILLTMQMRDQQEGAIPPALPPPPDAGGEGNAKSFSDLC